MLLLPNGELSLEIESKKMLVRDLLGDTLGCQLHDAVV